MKRRLTMPVASALFALLACGPLGAITGGEGDAVATLPTAAEEEIAEETPVDPSTDAQVDAPAEAAEPVDSITVTELAPFQYTSGGGLDVVALTLSPDGQQLVSAGWGDGVGNSRVVFFDVVSGTPAPSPEERTGWGLSNRITYLAGGDLVITTDLIGILGAFDATNYELRGGGSIDPYPGEDTLDLVTGGADTIFTLKNTGEIAEVSIPSGQVVNSVQVYTSPSVDDLIRLPNGNLLAIGSDVEFDDAKALREFRPDLTLVSETIIDRAIKVGVSADGSQVLLQTKDGSLYLVASIAEVATSEPIGTLCSNPADIAFSPAGNLIAVTAENCAQQIYEVETGALVYDSNDANGGRGAVFSLDGTRLFMGTQDRGIAVFEVPTPEGFVPAEAPAVEVAPAETEEASEPASESDEAAPAEVDTELIPIPQNDAELDALPFAADTVSMGEAANFCPEFVTDADFEGIFGLPVINRFNDDFEAFGPVIGCGVTFEDNSLTEYIIRRFPTERDAQLLWVEEQYFYNLDSETVVFYEDIGTRASYNALPAAAQEGSDAPQVLQFYAGEYHVMIRYINTTTDVQSLLEALARLIVERIPTLP